MANGVNVYVYFSAIEREASSAQPGVDAWLGSWVTGWGWGISPAAAGLALGPGPRAPAPASRAGSFPGGPCPGGSAAVLPPRFSPSLVLIPQDRVGGLGEQRRNQLLGELSRGLGGRDVQGWLGRSHRAGGPEAFFGYRCRSVGKSRRCSPCPRAGFHVIPQPLLCAMLSAMPLHI